MALWHSPGHHLKRDNAQQQRLILKRFGADDDALDELQDYCTTTFDTSKLLSKPNQLPMADEAFVDAWRGYQHQAVAEGVPSVLEKVFIQWHFPVLSGIAASEFYIAVTRRFAPVAACESATGHRFEEPQGIGIHLYQSLAGHIPVLSFSNRTDFEYALLSLSNHNEPKSIPKSLGACLIAGYNNIERINCLKKSHPRHHSSADWPLQLPTLLADKNRYQDKFILISSGPYSDRSAEEMQLDDARWIELSTKIRMHHEATHYFTKRVCGSMKLNLFDELIADYMGITLSIGRYRADWFLRFMGFDEQNKYQPGGRLQHYTQQITRVNSLAVLCALLVQAACNLQIADERYSGQDQQGRAVRIMCALMFMSIDELAAAQGHNKLLSLIHSLPALPISESMPPILPMNQRSCT